MTTMEHKKMDSDPSHPSGDDSVARVGSARRLPQLGSRQRAVLQMMNPEWVSSVPGRPDAASLRVLEALEYRGLVQRNYRRWTITELGRVVRALGATA